ncbi:hypothetical protein BLD25_01620 [Candidatus Gracilibacteria bacterium GN02-872]|nr:hypothetical protein BLD25_01620 [Candidatus Gracilibacteria bacterium GN02-872]
MLQKINQFSFSDAEIFIKLRKESLKNSGEFLMTYEDEEQNFTAKGYVEGGYLRNYYFIVFENKVVGYLKFAQQWNTFQGKHNYIIGPIYISEKFRNRGIAFIALSEMEEIIQTQNSSKYLTLHLQVSEKNLAAINLYKKLGYSISGTVPKYIHTKEGEFIGILCFYKILGKYL